MPGVHTVGSTGGGTTTLEPPVPVVLPVPELMLLPVPEPVVLPVPEPELAPDPEPVLPWPLIEPWQPARSAAPTMMVFAQVFIALTSSRYSGWKK